MIDIFTVKNRDASNPFEGDYLDMEVSVKKTIDKFMQVNYNIGQGSVMGISSPFGTGKSTYINMCQAYMQQKNKSNDTSFISSYINLSENEFHNNPLLIILKSICRSLDSFNREFNDNGIENKDMEIIITKLIKLALKMTAPFDTNKFLEESVEVNSHLYRRFTQDDDFAKQKFTLYLEEMVQGKKLIVFLDDIDRCSPNFAIKILEQLKFYFETLNITFIVAYDRSQLEDFLRIRFGKHIDIEGYLQKFFDYNYMFNPVSKNKFIDKTVETCVERLELDKELESKLENIVEKIKIFKIHLKYYSLRDLQQIIFRIAFGLNYINSNNKERQLKDFENLIVILVFARRLGRNIYKYLYNGNIDGVEFCFLMAKNKKLEELFERDIYLPLLSYNQDSTIKDNFKKTIENKKLILKKLEVENNINIISKNLDELKEEQLLSDNQDSTIKDNSETTIENKKLILKKLEVENSLDNIINNISMNLDKLKKDEFYKNYNAVQLCFDILEYD